MRTNHKLLDLFSGIGGFSLGAERNGIETIGFVEKDKFCQKVLKKHWSDVPIIDDIRKVNGKDFGAATIISGGFPCQPFSTAGKRRGTDDDRYLWDETIRVVAECKPRWFIGENVEGLINIEDGMVLRSVQDDLEREGFQVQCLVIPASGIGAWHQRKRVWIIGYSEHNGSSTTQKQKGNTQTSTGPQKRENSSLQSERTSRPTDNGNVSNTNSSLRRGRGTISQGGKNKIWGFHSKEEKQNQSDLRSKTIRCNVVSGEKENVSDSSNERQLHRESGNLGEESRKTQGAGKKNTQGIEDTSSRGSQKYVSNTKCERLERHSKYSSAISKQDQRLQFRNESGTGKSSTEQKSWWQTESELRRVPDGVSYELHSDRTNRIKALGNSIVPQIAEQIFRSIIDAE